MKKYLLLTLSLLLLTGCGMSHKEMLDKKKLCEDLELDWEYVYAEFGVRTEKVICVNKKDE